MKRVTIRCRAPEPQCCGPVILNGVLPTLADCEILIDVEPLTNALSFFVTAEPNEPVRVWIELVGCDLELDGILKEEPPT